MADYPLLFFPEPQSLELDNLPPTEDFYDIEDREKKLSGRLFLTMTNQRALNEMLSLWEQYSNDPTIQFRRGLAGFKSLFKKLKNIRRWDVQDRLIETGVINYWNQEIRDQAQIIRFELQLWFSSSEVKRQQTDQIIKALIGSLGGRCITSSVIPEISYHALLVELSTAEIQNIIDSPTSELVRFDDIMFFRPSGQIAIKDNYEDEESGETSHEIKQLPSGLPVAALFDGLPVENHHLPASRLMIDDPDNFSDNYESRYRLHGTGMSSLIIHGDLSNNGDSIATPLYVRPIMKLRTWVDGRIERVPDDVLFVDLLHVAVRRIFEGDMDREPIQKREDT